MSTPRTWFRSLIFFNFVGFSAVITLMSVARVYAQASSPWPIFRSDAGLSGRSPVEGPNIPDLYWTKPIGIEKIQSPAVAQDGTVIFTSRGDQYVYASNPDGKEKWRFSHRVPGGSNNETFSFPPTLDKNGTIYVGSHEHGFFAINQNGTLKWRAQVGGYVGTAANIDKNGNIYIAVDDAQLYVFDPAGNLLCTGSLDGLKPNNTPAIASNGRVYVPAGNSIFVFNSSCQPIARWVLPSLEQVAWVAINAGGNVVYAGSVTLPLVVALNSQTGNQVWDYSYHTSYGPPSQPALGPSGTIYFVGANAGLMIALNPNGQEKWTFDVGSTRYKTMPVVDASGDIYIVNESSKFGLFKLSPSKEVLWQLPNVQCFYSPAFGPDGTIYVPSLKKLYAVRPQPPFPVRLELVSGDGQTGCIDSTLANPIQARVLDQYGNPFEGQAVRFRVIKGGGEPQDTTVNTDSVGIASIPWRLGSVLGEQQLEISSQYNDQPLIGSPDTVFATAHGPAIDGDSLVVFKATAVKHASDTTYTIHNISDCILTVNRLEVAGDPSFFVKTPVRDTLIAPHGSIIVRLQFAPLTSGKHSATLSIFSNDSARPQFDVLLSGEAFTEPRISIDPKGLDFLQVDVGDSLSKSITIYSVGTAELEISAFNFSDPAHYKIDLKTPLKIPAGERREASVTFTPKEGRQYPATLEVVSNDKKNDTVVVALSGSGTLASDIDASPNPLPFAKVCLDSCAKLPLTIRNVGNDTLVVDSIKTSDPVFTVEGQEFSIPPGDSVTVLVGFCPKDVKVYSGTLSIFSNDPDENPFEVALQGEGVGPEIAVEATPASLELCRGDSAIVAISITNTSACTVRVDSIRRGIFFPLANTQGMPGFVNTASAFPISVPPGERHVEFIDILSAPPVDFELRVRVYSNTTPNPVNLTVPVKIKPPVIAAVDTVDFDSVTVGTSKTLEAQAWAKQCQVRVDSARITGTDFFAFSLQPKLTYPITLNEGDTTNIPVTFHPKDEGFHTAILEAISNDTQHNPIRIVLIGNGVNPVPIIVVSDTSFGTACDTVYQNVVVSNIGQAVLQVTDLDFDNPSFFTAHAKQFEVPAGGKETISVGYAPTVGQPADGQMAVFSNASKVDSIAVLRGQGGAPDIAGSPSPLNFPVVDIRECESAQDSSAATFRIQNLGACDLVISSFRVDGNFSIAPIAVPVIIPPKGDANLTLYFKPNAKGNFAGSLHVFSNDLDTPELIVPLNGTANATPKIATQPADTLNFGKVPINTSADSIVLVMNIGGDTLRVTNIAVTGTVFVPNTALFELACKDTQKVNVKFTPNAVGRFEEKLTFTSNGGTKTVVLIGEGIAPMIAVAPASLPFGTVCDTTYLSVTISDTGEVALEVSEFIFTNSAFFTKHPTPFTIAAGGQVPISVGYVPTSGQSATGELLIVSNAANADTVSVTLTGQGGVPDIAGSPSPLNFPAVDIRECENAQDSSEAAFRIQNLGACDLVISAFRVDGSFSFVPIAVPLVIPKNRDTSITLYFKPKVKGSSAGSLHVFSNDLDTPELVVPLNGTANATPKIAAKPDTLDFGKVPINTSVDSTVMVMNVGGDTLRVTKIEVTGTVFEPNSVLFEVTCKDTQKVTVKLTPNAVGRFEELMTFTSNGGTKTVVLIGEGTSPDIDGAREVVFDPVEVQKCAGKNNADTLTYPLRNNGNRDLTITAFRTRLPFEVIAPSTPQTISAGGQLAVTLSFMPQTDSIYVDTLFVESNDPDENPFKVVLRGEGVTQPDIAVAPDTLDFGAVTIGSTAWLPDTVRNVGEKALVVVEMSFTNPAFATETREFSLNCSKDSVLTIAFTPKDTIAYLDTLWIVSNDPDENPAMVILKGSGTPPPPPPRGCIVVSPDSKNFGTLCDDDSAMFVVRDTCAGPLQVSNLVFTNLAFWTRHDSSFTILPGQSDTIWVHFKPTAAKSDTGSFLIYSNAENDTLVSVPLEGAGGAPDIAVEKDEVTFPPVEVQRCSGSTKSTALTFEVFNKGNCDLTISSLSLSPGSPFEVVPKSPPPLVIPKGASHSLTLRFKPLIDGIQVDTLRITSDDPDLHERVIRVVLRGEGIFLPDIEVKPSALQFDSTKVGSSAKLPVTVRNLGAALLTVDSLVVSDPAFRIDNDKWEFALGCNADSVLIVTFSPKDTIAYKGTLWIWHNDDNSTNPFPVPLNGVGTLGALVACARIEFDEACVGNVVEKSCAITNKGSADFNITSVLLASQREPDEGDGANSSFAVVPTELVGSLKQRASKEVKIAFTARSTKLESDTLLISTDLPAPNHLHRIVLTGLASEDRPKISVTPLLFFVGRLDEETAMQPVSIRNDGCKELELGNILLDQSQYFFIKELPKEKKLLRGDSVIVMVSFKGDNFTSFADELYVASNDPSQPQDTTKLKGEVKDGRICLEISPQTVDFQKVHVKRRSDPMEVKLINCSRTTRLHFKISPPRLQDDFAVNRMEFTSIPDPDSGRKVESIYVTFTPQAIGVREDVLELLITVPNPDGGVLKDSVAYIYLKGEGIGDPEKVKVVSNVVTPNDDEFNEETILEYSEKKYPEAVLHIFDLRGLPVRVFRRPTGPNQFAWNGRDENGGLVLPSVYLWIIENQGKRVASGRFVVIR